MNKGRRTRHWREVVRPAAYRRDLERRARCWICGGEIDYTASNNPGDKDYSPWAWEPDHIHDVATHPWLAEDLANIAPCHSRCNRKRAKKRSEKKAETSSESLGTPSRDWGMG